jgi:hypothetical protein
MQASNRVIRVIAKAKRSRQMRKKQIYLVRFATLTLLTAAFAWNICQCKMISITAAGPSAVNCANAKTGPLLPPDPWESNFAKTGPLLPPDPWESNFAKTGPLLPPDPWESNFAKTGPLLPPDPWESNFAKTGPLLPPDPWESNAA